MYKAKNKTRTVMLKSEPQAAAFANAGWVVVHEDENGKATLFSKLPEHTTEEELLATLRAPVTKARQTT